MKALVTVFVLMFSVQAYGDIFDRIDRCENRGGGSCVYDILRELARSGGGNGGMLRGGLFTRQGTNNWWCEVHEVNTIMEAGQLVQLQFDFCNNGGWEATLDCSGNYCSNSEYTVSIEGPTTYTMTHSSQGSMVYQWGTELESLNLSGDSQN